MSAVSDAFANFQTALTNKITAMEAKDFFIVDPADSTGIKTTKNVKVIGSVLASGDVEGNLNIS